MNLKKIIHFFLGTLDALISRDNRRVCMARKCRITRLAVTFDEKDNAKFPQLGKHFAGGIQNRIISNFETLSYVACIRNAICLKIVFLPE